MRVFVAVFPPPGIQEALHHAVRALPKSGEFRLTSPEKIHLTLKFLGDVAEDDVSRVAESLKPVREKHAPFEVVTSGFGAFPSERRARILWAGVGEGFEPLRVLARDVEDLLRPAGFEPTADPTCPT